jgi:hypothetical protein
MIKDTIYIASVGYVVSQEGIRAYIKPTTVERLGKYAKFRLGIATDDLINEALDTLEEQLRVPQLRVKESRKK